MIKFYYTILYVEDVQKSLEFYTKVFDFGVKMSFEDGSYAELDTGGTTLALVSYQSLENILSQEYQKVDKQKYPFGIEIAMCTDDVQSLIDKAVSEGATLFESVKVKSWGQTVGYVRDINGFLIEICTPMD